MTNINYIRATNAICDAVEDWIVEGSFNLPETSFSDVLIYFTDGITEIVPKEDVVYYEVSDEVGYHLCEAARQSRETFDLVSKICAFNVLNEKPLPFGLRYFALETLQGRFERPSAKGRPTKRNWFEKAVIWSLAKHVESEFALPLTRNDEKKPTGDLNDTGRYSACDAVAVALTGLDRKTSYNEVKGICVHPDHALFRSQQDFLMRLDKERQKRSNAVLD